jgi:Zn-dependent M28 family amino/carboxypeptidase
VLVTAEEKGLLGSRYFAFHPTVKPEALVANLNTDMFLPLMPFRLLMVNGLEESDLADDARRVGQAMGVEVITDPEPEENRFVRSDQYSFVLRGIPALSLKVGFRRDSPEHALIRRFRAERYHFPADDLSQPVDRQSAEDFGRLHVELVKAVANRVERPKWLRESYFGSAGPPRGR